MKKDWKLFLHAILGLACIFPSKAHADVRIKGAANYQIVGRGLTWASGVNQNFIMDVVSPSSGMCLQIRNNDTSSHAYTITPMLTSDLFTTTFTGNTGAWTATTISPTGATTTAASSTDNFFINTTGAAHVTITISGGSGTGNADITIAQTSNQCGTGGIGSIGQAVACDKSAQVVVATATTQVLVPTPPAGQSVHVCAFMVSGGSATGATHQFGTGSAGACAVHSDIWGMASPASSAPMQFSLGAGIGQLFKTATVTQPLCFTNGGSGANLLASVSYTNF